MAEIGRFFILGCVMEHGFHGLDTDLFLNFIKSIRTLF